MIVIFNGHNHTELGSNIRLIDAICKPKDLIDRAIELGLSGIAITEHEFVGSAIEVNQYAKKIKETNPDFTIALGNEIYLTETRDKKQKYFHFILIAKDKIGAKALRILSSQSWFSSYYDRGMVRVPTLKSELKELFSNETYKGHVIATNACLGGELPYLILNYLNDENEENYKKITNFISYCKEIFGSDFYFECQPAESKEQILVNKFFIKLSKEFGVKITCSSDTHYLKKEDRYVHKAYLNSKDGDREVDDFYEYTYLMDEQETREHLRKSFSDEEIDEIFATSEEIRKKIEYYDLSRPQIIPKITVKDYPSFDYFELKDKFPTLYSLFSSDDIQERYWANECFKALKEKFGEYKLEYIERLEIEADVIKYIGNNLNDCLFCYFNTFKHYIDLFWECGSIVGPGRGSSTGFLSNFLLGITQLDPIKWNLQYWRFLNKGRVSLPDIDIDLDPTIRPLIFERIREERGQLGLVQVCTYGSEGTRSTILTACRGYRSKDFPDGIDVDIAQYMSSLIPVERGFLWPVKDVMYGNQEKGRKPISAFINEVNKYPGLLDIIFGIEGLHNKVGIHASGVILYGDDPYETAAFMRAPSGEIITQYNLTFAETAGDTKYDYLVTEVTTKLRKCLELLQEDGVIEKDSLRNIYNKYLHPDTIDITNSEIWEHLKNGDILDVFQFNEGSGLAIAKKLAPKNPLEMTAANAIMRLMNEPGQESQGDRFVRVKNNPKLFDEEMRQAGVSSPIAEALHEYCDEYYGCVPLQEQMMQILMDYRIAGFSLQEADYARKVVAKKKMNEIPKFREMVFSKINNKKDATYVWDTAIRPSLGYAFSINHSLPYSFVGIQTILLATKFPSIYWNTACLIVNSGSAEIGSGTVDYKKIAKAIGAIQSNGIKLTLVNINNSDFTFKPDAKNNQILYALKALNNVGDEFIQNIIKNRPYISLVDFYYRVKPNKREMISLIKAGAFDEFCGRQEAMIQYLWLTCDKKSRITLQNMPGLMRYNLLPREEKYIFARRVYEFNRYLKDNCKYNSNTYRLDSRAIDFLNSIDREELYDNNFLMDTKTWDKAYKSYMDIFRNWMKKDQEKILENLNTAIFMEDWNKYATGNISSWEMEALCFYYHDHELKNVDNFRYNLVDYFSLPEEPIVEKVFKKGKSEIPIYKLYCIAGTVIAKNKDKAIAYVLTTTGVVTVKFRKEYFSLFDSQISKRNNDGSKTVIERSWFNKGNKLIIQGIRRSSEFVAKSYKSSNRHTLYHIDEVTKNGSLALRSERAKGEVDEEEI